MSVTCVSASKCDEPDSRSAGRPSLFDAVVPLSRELRFKTTKTKDELSYFLLGLKKKHYK